METTAMGSVVIPAVIENIHDLYEASQGSRAPEAVRRVEVPNALVDTGATYLGMPAPLIAQLGLQPAGTRQARTGGGRVSLRLFGTARLTVQGRTFTGDVMELPDDCPVVIGVIPLEGLDFVVDPNGRRLIGNPEHGGEYVIDML